MIQVKCSKCEHGRLKLDDKATYEDYYKTSGYLVDEKGILLDETVQLYLVYKCLHCRKKFNYTFKEIEELFRKEMASFVLKMKQAQYIKENWEQADMLESNIMILCGECEGFDGKDKCPDRFFNRCALRKKSHGIQLP